MALASEFVTEEKCVSSSDSFRAGAGSVDGPGIEVSSPQNDVVELAGSFASEEIVVEFRLPVFIAKGDAERFFSKVAEAGAGTLDADSGVLLECRSSVGEEIFHGASALPG